MPCVTLATTGTTTCDDRHIRVARFTTAGGAAATWGDAWAEFWADWWRGPAPRPERGVVRYLILDAIRTQPRHGYEIIQAIGDKSHGAYRPSPGVVYPTLQMLEEMQHARTTEQEERKAYAITEKGEADLKEHEDEVADFYRGPRQPAPGRRPPRTWRAS